MAEKETMIPLSLAQLCVNCDTISDTRTEICPKCQAEDCLLNLGRILNPASDLGSADDPVPRKVQ